MSEFTPTCTITVTRYDHLTKIEREQEQAIEEANKAKDVAEAHEEAMLHRMVVMKRSLENLSGISFRFSKPLEKMNPDTMDVSVTNDNGKTFIDISDGE